MGRQRLIAGCVVLAAAIVAGCASRARSSQAPEPTQRPAQSAPVPVDPVRETRRHVDRIRTITPGADERTAREFNQRLEEAWAWFGAHRADALPVLRDELARELRLPKPNAMVLLDIGYYLYRSGDPVDRPLARRALLALDPAADIVRWNQQELFEFTHALAVARDAAVLPFIDRAFLRDDVTIGLPQQSLRLDPVTVCVFLYGAYGPAAEKHLRARLGDRAVARRVVEILSWIGSPASAADVRSALAASPMDHEMFLRAARYMMGAAGPRGRAIMLAVKPAALDPRSREYYGKVRKDIVGTSYETLRKRYDRFARGPKMSDAELRRRISAAYTAANPEYDLRAAAILDSSVPSAWLIVELEKVRARMLARVSAASLLDVPVVNEVINTLRFRKKP